MSIVLIGAGGIVNDAHLPAYRLAGFDVAGIFDLDAEKAQLTAQRFSIPLVYKSLQQAMAGGKPGSVFDIAVPADKLLPVLEQVPGGSTVLMQKPMGEHLDQAQEILRLVRAKKITAGVNFQLRYAPCVSMARKMIGEGCIGDLCDIEANINVYTPWHLWDFLFTASRVEMLYHSIHYIDLVRSFLGNPSGVYAKTVKHPQMAALASVKSSIILDYGDRVRANIFTNHCNRFGVEQQQSYIRFEGTRGVVRIQLGALLDYPAGSVDTFEYVILEEGSSPQWKCRQVEGAWFPHAFIGSMREMLKAAGEPGYLPDNTVEDGIYTMACVEAAYASSLGGGTTLFDFAKQ